MRAVTESFERNTFVINNLNWQTGFALVPKVQPQMQPCGWHSEILDPNTARMRHCAKARLWRLAPAKAVYRPAPRNDDFAITFSKR